ncbi:hypothetical protein [Nonlabens ponticola]|uniref:Lipoprotein n=1 Tax=Nonlabens ponticola TaxID=2496866 RepID=A0A3S9MWJ8_9FLAO|nr:hypothetical protein [Nonlabens ponticola]AZQ43514.1 hypothetical protein EJ995_04425 [Nonlabens ponticola]
MRKFFLILALCPILFSCSDFNGKKNGEPLSQVINSSRTDSVDCSELWAKRFWDDEKRNQLIDSIISSNDLTPNNSILLNRLRASNKNNLVFKKPLAPIYRLSPDELGIFSFPKYNMEGDVIISFSPEISLMDSHGIDYPLNTENYGVLQFFPSIMDSMYSQQERPKLFYHTDQKTGVFSIENLGVYEDECLTYHQYSIDTTSISLEDHLLFSSPFKIDLVFENKKEVDYLFKTDPIKNCADCGNSWHLQKTFARLEGTENVFFVYADTFPLNNELDTPSRALIYVTDSDEVIYLWYEEIDLFGCSCL